MDEQGNRYEATYPKRAKGLVKNGRARFVDETTICLACPPNRDLEVHNMSENMENREISQIAEAAEQRATGGKLSMEYILDQIEKIAGQTEYLYQVIDKLGSMADGDNADGMSPGNTLGQAKAEALGNVVQSREATNQQLLQFYEKMYDDLKPKSQDSMTGRQKVVTALLEILQNPSADAIAKEDASEILKQYMQTE